MPCPSSPILFSEIVSPLLSYDIVYLILIYCWAEFYKISLCPLHRGSNTFLQHIYDIKQCTFISSGRLSPLLYLYK